jgi:hypothetical protein
VSFRPLSPWMRQRHITQTSKGCLVPIDVDLGRPWDSSMGDNCTEKCLRRLHIAIIAEQRPDGLSILVHPPK